MLKVKDWLINGKPQYSVLCVGVHKVNENRTTRVLRLKDNKIFDAGQEFGHIQIVGFHDNLIDVYLYVRGTEVQYENGNTEVGFFNNAFKKVQINQIKLVPSSSEKGKTLCYITNPN